MWRLVRLQVLIGIIVGVHSFPTKNRETTPKDGLRNLLLATIIPIRVRFGLTVIEREDCKTVVVTDRYAERDYVTVDEIVE